MQYLARYGIHNMLVNYMHALVRTYVRYMHALVCSYAYMHALVPYTQPYVRQVLTLYLELHFNGKTPRG